MKEKDLAREMMQMMFMMGKNKGIHHDCEDIRGRDIMVLKAIESLDHGKPVKMNMITNYFHISAPATSQIIRRFENLGFVERIQLEDDRRSVYIQLSDHAKEIIQKNEEELYNHFRGLIDYLGEADAEKFIELIHRTNTYVDSAFRKRKE